MAACGPRATAGPTGAPSPGASPTSVPSPTPAGIAHPTGSRDVVLRMESGGGLVPVEMLVSHTPSFTLFGDGLVLFKEQAAGPPPAAGGATLEAPFLAVRLGEPQIQAWLEYALGPGGLGLARGPYMGPGADLPTTTFTISAGGGTKSVSVTGLGLEFSGPDAVIVAALRQLSERIAAFGGSVPGAQPWTPDRYRGVLMPVDVPFGPVHAWPWSGIKPADFVEKQGPDAPRFPNRTMSAEEVAAIGVPDARGGFAGLNVKGPDGKLYSLALRPLLPDESA